VSIGNINTTTNHDRSASAIYRGPEQNGNVTRTSYSGHEYTVFYKKPSSNSGLSKLPQLLKKIGAAFKSLLSTSVSSQLKTTTGQENGLRNIKSETGHKKNFVSREYNVVSTSDGFKFWRTNDAQAKKMEAWLKNVDDK
jgi:hypothetical protein